MLFFGTFSVINMMCEIAIDTRNVFAGTYRLPLKFHEQWLHNVLTQLSQFANSSRNCSGCEPCDDIKKQLKLSAGIPCTDLDAVFEMLNKFEVLPPFVPSAL